MTRLEDRAFELITDLGLHIPDELEFTRDIRSKLCIRKTDSKQFGPAKKYTRITRLYQCSCGTDHSAGRWASKKRQNPWDNVDCNMFAKVVTTHTLSNPNGFFFVYSILYIGLIYFQFCTVQTNSYCL